MDAKTPEDALSTLRFGIGQSVLRGDDDLLLRGKGRFCDDVRFGDELFGRVVRSPYPHGRVRAVDTEAAGAVPGVVAVYTGLDIPFEGPRSGVPYKGVDGSPLKNVPHPPLAHDRVLFIGQPVAFVVAETAQAARDAAEAVVADIEPLAAVTTAEEATAPGAPDLHGAEIPGNVALDYAFGDADEVDAALRAAHHVTRLTLVSNRVVVNPMEPRAARVLYDAETESWTVYATSQGSFLLARALARVLKVDIASVNVVSANVGGSFGMKNDAYPELFCLVHAARDLGRPVRWTDDRSESFLSDHQGRDTTTTGELGLDADGNFVALRLTGTGNIGAYPVGFGPHVSSFGIVKNIVSVYRTPKVASRSQCVCTNTTPTAPYRGAGRPEGNYIMERLIDQAAHETGVDPVELRRRNLIPASALPIKVATGNVYDSGDFAAVLDKALSVSDWEGFAARKADAAARGRLRGRGLGLFLEATAPAMNEQADIRFADDGTVTVYTGTHDQGQGHRTAFAQVLAERLGVPFEAVRIEQAESRMLKTGGGTGGSKSLMSSGTAIWQASEKVVDKGRSHAAHLLEADREDIEFAVTEAGGRFSVAGTDLGMGIMELAEKLRDGQVPAGPDGEPASLDTLHLIDTQPATYPNGAHVCEVEIDPQTGIAEVVRYTMVNDFGVVVNPMLVEGQAHGGVVQGIGQALMENVAYDADGQVLTGSFMDYAMPHAGDVPVFEVHNLPFPATTNPLGVKGCGEAGCAGALPSVMNAVVDALSEFGIDHIDMPATPERIWRAIHQHD